MPKGNNFLGNPLYEVKLHPFSTILERGVPELGKIAYDVTAGYYVVCVDLDGPDGGEGEDGGGTWLPLGGGGFGPIDDVFPDPFIIEQGGAEWSAIVSAASWWTTDGRTCKGFVGLQVDTVVTGSPAPGFVTIRGGWPVPGVARGSMNWHESNISGRYEGPAPIADPGSGTVCGLGEIGTTSPSAPELDNLDSIAIEFEYPVA